MYSCMLGACLLDKKVSSPITLYSLFSTTPPQAAALTQNWISWSRTKYVPSLTWMMSLMPSLCFLIVNGSQTLRCTTLPAAMSPNRLTCFATEIQLLMKEKPSRDNKTTKEMQNHKRTKKKKTSQQILYKGERIAERTLMPVLLGWFHPSSL